MLPLLEHLSRRGLDALTVLDQAGLTGADRVGAGTRLPQRRFDALWRAAIEATQDPAIALRVATQIRPSTLGIIGYLASASESRRNAFELVRGLTPLLWEDFSCDLEVDGDEAFMRFEVRGEPSRSRFTAEYAVGLAIAMSRSLDASGSAPLEARFAHPPPAHASQYSEILGLPVRFNASEDGVLFPVILLESSNPSADAGLRQLLEQYAVDQLADLPVASGLPGRTRATIRAFLPRGDVSAQAVAKHLNMSDRTLRRRLREAGTCYQAVLDGVRTALARRYLGEEGRDVHDTAALLAFSDSSAFTKAFRRATGVTPAQFIRSGRYHGAASHEPNRIRPGRGPLRTRVVTPNPPRLQRSAEAASGAQPKEKAP